MKNRILIFFVLGSLGAYAEAPNSDFGGRVVCLSGKYGNPSYRYKIVISHSNNGAITAAIGKTSASSYPVPVGPERLYEGVVLTRHSGHVNYFAPKTTKGLEVPFFIDIDDHPSTSSLHGKFRADWHSAGAGNGSTVVGCSVRSGF